MFNDESHEDESLSPITIDDKVNPIPALQKVLEAVKIFDSNFCLKSNNPMFSPIINFGNVAKISNIEKYAMDIQSNAIKKQFSYFIIFETTISFPMLKESNNSWSWLCEMKLYLNPHMMHSNYVTEIGFFMGMHLTLSMFSISI
jgi:hypothetical protein